MFASALLVAITVFLAVAFYLMGALRYLIPYRPLLLHDYALAILGYAAALFVNVFALAFSIHRKFFLKDTGRKLVHFDQEIQAGESQLGAQMAERLGGLR